MSHEHRHRSILKAMSYRVTGTLFTFGIAWLLTGEVVVAASIGGIEAVSKLFIYYWHERLWDKIKYGKKSQSPDYEI
jgi:uncharacterized membrane protein